MKKPLIIAKSAPKNDDILVKERIGCDGIEIQLLKEFGVDTGEVPDLKIFQDKKIYAVHCPLQGIQDYFYLEYAVFEDVLPLCRVAELCQKIAEMNHCDIRLVMHSGIGLNVGKLGRKKMVDIFDYLLREYPNVIFCIENVTPFSKLNKESAILSNNFSFDCVQAVKMLRESLGTSRVRLVLDVCHQMITKSHFTVLQNVLGLQMPDFSLENFLIQFSPYLDIIHLANMRKEGYGENHGISFEDNTKQKLFVILSMIDKYSPESVITIEVRESDYNICDGYRKTKELVDEYYSDDNRKDYFQKSIENSLKFGL